MQYLKTYLQKITDRGNVKLAESIEKTVEDLKKKIQEISEEIQKPVVNDFESFIKYSITQNTIQCVVVCYNTSKKS